MGNTKNLRYSLLIVIIIVLANFLLNLFNKHEISNAKDDINKAKDKIETAIVKIDSAQNRIQIMLDSIDADRQKLKEMNKDVNLLNISMQSKINFQSSKIKPLQDSVKSSQYKLHTLKKELKNLK